MHCHVGNTSPDPTDTARPEPPTQEGSAFSEPGPVLRWGVTQRCLRSAQAL